MRKNRDHGRISNESKTYEDSITQILKFEKLKSIFQSFLECSRGRKLFDFELLIESLSILVENPIIALSFFYFIPFHLSMLRQM